MKFKVHASKVRSESKKRGIHPAHAAFSIVKHNEKALGRLYSNGFRTGFNDKPRLTRKDFVRNRDWNSYLTGYLNGLRLNLTFKTSNKKGN